MSYQIELTPEALADLKTLPAYIRAQAKPLIATLADNPRPSFAKELRGKPNIYRVWLAGRWRVAYEVDDDNTSNHSTDTS